MNKTKELIGYKYNWPSIMKNVEAYRIILKLISKVTTFILV